MTDNQVLKTIYNRRSIRKYQDKTLTKEQIDQLVKAALISPSSRNMEPWHLTVLTNQSTILEWEKDVVQYFVDNNVEWAVKHNKSRGNKIFYDAPAVFVISMEEGKEMDVGIMAQSIALAAKGMGLDSVILGLPRVSFNPEYNNKWQDALEFPEDYVYGIAVAVGYGDDEGKGRKADMSKVSYIK